MRSIKLALALLLLTVNVNAQTLGGWVANTTNPFTGDGIGEVSFASATTAGRGYCVVFGVDNSNRNVTTVTDNATPANTYSLVLSNEVISGVESWIYCSIHANSATQASVTLSSAINAGILAVFEVSGNHASDFIGGTATSSNTTTSHTCGTVTAEVASSRLYGHSYGTTGTYTIDGTFTQLQNNTFFVGGHKAITGNSSMTNTTSANETTVTLCVELLPSASATRCCGGSLRGIVLEEEHD